MNVCGVLISHYQRLTALNEFCRFHAHQPAQPVRHYLHNLHVNTCKTGL